MFYLPRIRARKVGDTFVIITFDEKKTLTSQQLSTRSEIYIERKIDKEILFPDYLIER